VSLSPVEGAGALGTPKGCRNTGGVHFKKSERERTKGHLASLPPCGLEGFSPGALGKGLSITVLSGLTHQCNRNFVKKGAVRGRKRGRNVCGSGKKPGKRHA